MVTVLLTRPRPMAEEFAALLGDAAEVLIAPLTEIRPVEAGPLPEAEPIFTSRNGVAGFVQSGGRAEGPCWCVGQATARAAIAAGFTPKIGGGDASSLIAAILNAENVGPLVHIRGRHTRGDIADHLTAHGLKCDQVVVYDQVLLPLDPKVLGALQSEKPMVLPLFSPRGASHLSGELRAFGDRVLPLFAVCISDAVAEAFGDLTVTECLVAKQPDVQSMLVAVEHAKNRARLLEAGAGGE